MQLWCFISQSTSWNWTCAVFAGGGVLPVSIIFGKNGFIDPSNMYYGRKFTLHFGEGQNGTSYEVALQVRSSCVLSPRVS